jgi:hypothetical protein
MIEMALEEAMNKVRRLTTTPWQPGDIGGHDDNPMATESVVILNAVASGQLVTRADADLAVAEALRKASGIGGQTGSLMSWERRDAIRALATPEQKSALDEMLAAERAQADRWQAVAMKLREALDLADAALSGANMDMRHVWQKLKSPDLRGRVP